ncbi:acid phosphatase (class A) [Dyella sp. SG562]|uniref:acid phosphatase n=1 Tax=Dyella sp. SG562 TaxID=2587017 RepID=UPI00141F1DB7|nr:phosphatase PAP2 family protein [Dyella sp. SG562]NII72729.1 acid phosphatase (class A) [Dyella sp. SG562]
MRPSHFHARHAAWLFAAALAGCAAPAAKTPMPAAQAAKGYLADPAALHMAEVLPAAPKAGSARYEADRQVFRDTRKLEGTPRWALATSDVNLEVPDMLRDFSCAMGVTMDPARLPRLAALLKRVDEDGVRVTDPAKQANQRQRPFLIDEGAVCQSKDRLRRSFDYPSGHATWGWTVGLILTELAPDRANDVLLRARSFADSRVVCGAHNLSAIQAGQINGSAIVARLHAEPAFQADMAAAREELAALRAAGTPVDGGQCAAEHALIEQAPY